MLQSDNQNLFAPHDFQFYRIRQNNLQENWCWFISAAARYPSFHSLSRTLKNSFVLCSYLFLRILVTLAVSFTFFLISWRNNWKCHRMPYILCMNQKLERLPLDQRTGQNCCSYTKGTTILNMSTKIRMFWKNFGCITGLIYLNVFFNK